MVRYYRPLLSQPFTVRPLLRPLWLLIGTACMAGAASAQTLQVETDPAGARVEIDGVYVGATPLTREVAAGRHTVRIRRAGFATWQRDIDVGDQEASQIQVTLDQLLGTIALDGLPDRATVTADGVAVEPTTSIGVGIQTVVVRVPGRPDAQLRVPVADGGVTRVTYAPRQFAPVWLATSLAAPGVVQIVERRPLVGAAVLAGVAAAAGVALTADFGMREAQADYQSAVIEYNNARSEGDVDLALARIAQHIDRAEQRRTVRRAAVGAGVAVYAVGAIDGILHHALRPGLRAASPALPPISMHARENGLSLALHF